MIYFVGAGCGAADLITVRGKNLLERADVIIYAGSLVNPELLQYAGADAQIYNSAYMTLEEVLSLMEQAEKKGLTTVRLHTGDPSLYGAVQEQMEELDLRGIRYETCPGVSACFGAAADLNLEYTLPGISQTLIITRMEGRTKVPAREKIEYLATHHASMAIYLSAGMTGALQQALLSGGYSAGTRAAIVYRATWADEKIVPCEVGTLARAAADNNITRTAVILIGDVLEKSGYERSRLYDPDFETGYRGRKV